MEHFYFWEHFIVINITTEANFPKAKFKTKS